MTEDQLLSKCRGLIDSEYDVLEGFTEDDLYDYLASMYGEITREMSNLLYAEMF